MLEKNGIKKVAKITIISEDHFDKERDSISKENNLVRCPSCGKLLSKIGDSGKTIQHRGSQSIVRGEVEIKCPECSTVVSF